MNDETKAELIDRYPILHTFACSDMPPHVQHVAQPFTDIAYQLAFLFRGEPAELVEVLMDLSFDRAHVIVLAETERQLEALAVEFEETT